MHCFCNNLGPGGICCHWSDYGRKHHVPEKGGGLRPQGRRGLFYTRCFLRYYSAHLLFVLVCSVIWFVIFSQFGYFSFGGSTVICVFEKVCSFLSPFSVSFLLLDIANQLCKQSTISLPQVQVLNLLLDHRTRYSSMLILWQTARDHWKPLWRLARRWAPPNETKSYAFRSCRSVHSNDRS